MSQAEGGTEQVITFCELPCDHTHARARTQTQKKEKPDISGNGSVRLREKNMAVLYYYW